MHHIQCFMEIGLHIRRLNVEKLFFASIGFFSPFHQCYTPYVRNLVRLVSTRRIYSINYNGSFVLWAVYIAGETGFIPHRDELSIY